METKDKKDNEIGVIILAFTLGLLLFGLLLQPWKWGGGFKEWLGFTKGDSAEAPLIAQASVDSEIDTITTVDTITTDDNMQAKIDELDQRNRSLEGQLKKQAEEHENAAKAFKNDTADPSTMEAAEEEVTEKAETTLAAATPSEDNNATKLSNAEGEINDLLNEVQRLRTDNEDLKKKALQAGDNSNANITQDSLPVANLTEREKALKDTAEKLKAREEALAEALANKKAEDQKRAEQEQRLIQQEATLAKEREDLAMQRQAMKMKVNSNINTIAAAEKKGIEKGEAMFKADAKDLNISSGELFKKLQMLKTDSPAELNNAYEVLKKENNAYVRSRIEFKSGWSKPGLDQLTALRTSLTSANPESSFLVVGYADQSGSSQINQAISKDRAISVAREVLSQIGRDRNVEAVYLGSTDRFSKRSGAKNRVVEVWEINAE